MRFLYIDKDDKRLARIVIILIMLLFVVTPFKVQGIPFSNFSGSTGRIGNGNGYFSDELTYFNMTSNKNIFIVTENNQINIVEPIGYALGLSSSPALILKGDSDLQFGFIASDGYLYFTDSQGIKKRKTRDTTTPYYANDTGWSGQILLVYAGASGKLVQFEDKVYFFEGTTLKYFTVEEYLVATVFTGISNSGSFTVLRKNGVLTVLHYYLSLNTCGTYIQTSFTQLFSSNSTAKNSQIYSSCLHGNNVFDKACGSVFHTAKYIYFNFYQKYGNLYEGYEKVFYLSDYSLKSTDFFIPSIKTNSNAVLVGSYSTVTLYDYSSAEYDVFGFLEYSGFYAVPEWDTVTNVTGEISGRISSYNYSKHKTIFGYFLPDIFDMIPDELWLFIILGLVLEYSLILLRR